MSKKSLLTGLILLTLILPLSNATTDPWFELDTDEDGFENGIDLCPNTPSSSNQLNQTTCSHTNHWVRQNGVEIHHRIGVGEGFEFEISPDQKYLAFKDNEHEISEFEILALDDMSSSLKEGDSQKKAKSFVFSKNSSVMYTTDGTYLSIYELNNSTWSVSSEEIDLRDLCAYWQCIDQMEMTKNGTHILLTTLESYDGQRYCGFAMLNLTSFLIDMNYNFSETDRFCSNQLFISSTVNGSVVFSTSGGLGIGIHEINGSKNTSIILENTANSGGLIAHSPNGKLFAHVADGPVGTFQISIQVRYLNNLTLLNEQHIHYSKVGYFEFSPDSINLIIHADAGHTYTTYSAHGLPSPSDDARFVITSNGSMIFTDSYHNLTFLDIYQNATTTFFPGQKSNRHIAFFGADRDNDTIAEISDAFPNDPTEWKDSDGDGVGDNSDNNGMNNSNDADIFYSIWGIVSLISVLFYVVNKRRSSNIVYLEWEEENANAFSGYFSGFHRIFDSSVESISNSRLNAMESVFLLLLSPLVICFYVVLYAVIFAAYAFVGIFLLIGLALISTGYLIGACFLLPFLLFLG